MIGEFVMKKTTKEFVIVLVALCIMCMVVLGIAQGGNNLESKLVGSWYEVYDNGEVEEWAMSFYEDGTCEINDIYGTGSWTILEDNTLKVTDFYGQTYLISNVEIQGNELTGEAYGSIRWRKQ